MPELLSHTAGDDYHIEVGVAQNENTGAWQWVHQPRRIFFSGPFYDDVCECCGFYVVHKQRTNRWIVGSSNCSFNDDAYVSEATAREFIAFFKKHRIPFKRKTQKEN